MNTERTSKNIFTYIAYVDFVVFAAGAVQTLFVGCVPTDVEIVVVIVVVIVDLR